MGASTLANKGLKLLMLFEADARPVPVALFAEVLAAVALAAFAVWFAAWAKSLPESSHLVHGWRDVVVYSSLLRHAQVPLWQAAAAIVVTTAVTAWVLLHTTGSARAKHAVHKLEQLQCAIKDKEKEVAALRKEVARVHNKAAVLEAEQAQTLRQHAEEVRNLRAQNTALAPAGERRLTQLGLSLARRADLQPVTTIICEPAVTAALAEPATTTAAVRSAVEAIARHLLANPDQLSAYLTLVGTTTLSSGSAENHTMERKATAAALSLVALRNGAVRSKLVSELMSAPDGLDYTTFADSASDAASQWDTLNVRLYRATAWEHEGRSAGEAVRDVMWYALGDGVANSDLFTKIERVAGALMVGVLARDGFMVAN